MVIQSILFPNVNICSEETLYLHRDKSLVLFDGYFNLFYLEKHHRYCDIEDLSLELKVSGVKNIRIMHDREMIRELTDNLVQNAIRYNKENGSVWVDVIAGDAPELVVRDNGIGIPPEDQKRVFERFYRVDKSRSKATGGTGLGLAIVKHIVELHDAKIELTSKVGEGTQIHVVF